MSNIERDLLSLTSQLQNYQVDEQGLSFLGRSLKLNTEEDAKVVAEEIDKCENLVFLDLDGNTVGIEAARRIAQSLSKHGEFKRAIWKNMFTGRTKEEIPPALDHLGTGVITANANLVELDLSDNAFGPIGVEGLSNLIHSSSFHSLQVLRLNNNGLGITGGKLLAKSLQQCYESSKKTFALRVFQAGRNRLENHGTEALARVFKMIGTLVEVSMPQNGIYSPGFTALSEAFKNNPHLKILNFNDNTVQKKGAAALAEALPHLQKLETLNLGDCLLKTDGAKLIAKALATKHTDLQTVILGHNEISLEGGMEIAKSMHNKMALVTLNLNGNKFGDDGIAKINEELKKNKRNDALQSFSEDEGVSDDEDGATDNDSDANSQEANESTNSGYTDDSNVLDMTEKLDDITLPRVTVAQFLDTPSSNNFIDLGLERYKLFTNYLETCEKEDFVKNALTILFAVSNLCDHNQKHVKSAATACALQLYKYLFEWAVENEKLSLLTNAILVHLRLIKAEEKNTLIDCNANTCINVLRAAMTEGNTIPKSSNDMIDLFLERKKLTYPTKTIEMSPLK